MPTVPPAAGNFSAQTHRYELLKHTKIPAIQFYNSRPNSISTRVLSFLRHYVQWSETKVGLERHNKFGTRGKISVRRGHVADSHSCDIWDYPNDTNKGLIISDSWYGAPIFINSNRQFECNTAAVLRVCQSMMSIQY